MEKKLTNESNPDLAHTVVPLVVQHQDNLALSLRGLKRLGIIKAESGTPIDMFQCCANGQQYAVQSVMQMRYMSPMLTDIRLHDPLSGSRLVWFSIVHLILKHIPGYAMPLVSGDFVIGKFPFSSRIPFMRPRSNSVTL
ncbi:hypothetical protein TNCV_4338541 [Trichonephila clavipes]|nr:hypothetical protein TNCV_4338541 [Trichonephila clavipes]